MKLIDLFICALKLRTPCTGWKQPRCARPYYFSPVLFVALCFLHAASREGLSLQATELQQHRMPLKPFQPSQRKATQKKTERKAAQGCRTVEKKKWKRCVTSHSRAMNELPSEVFSVLLALLNLARGLPCPACLSHIRSKLPRCGSVARPAGP